MATRQVVTRLIRDKKTLKFLSRDGDGEWTSRLQEARSFSTPFEAIRAKQNLKLRNVQLYYSFTDDPKEDFWVSLE